MLSPDPGLEVGGGRVAASHSVWFPQEPCCVVKGGCREVICGRRGSGRQVGAGPGSGSWVWELPLPVAPALENACFRGGRGAGAVGSCLLYFSVDFSLGNCLSFPFRSQTGGSGRDGRPWVSTTLFLRLWTLRPGRAAAGRGAFTGSVFSFVDGLSPPRVEVAMSQVPGCWAGLLPRQEWARAPGPQAEQVGVCLCPRAHPFGGAPRAL